MPERKAKKRVIKKITLETREEIQKLTLMNNAFMNLALEDNIPCVEEMLQTILHKPDLVVKTARTQKMYQGFKRSIYLDIYAEDSKGVIYNIEIQQADEGADPRRARFHNGMIDVHSLKAGQDFHELPECYVIFVTLNDGSHIIYINGSAKDDGTEIWKLIHDFRCTRADEMYFPRLAARVKFLKEDEEGITMVSNYFEAQQAKAIKAEQRKAAKAKEDFVLNLISLGKLTLEEIAKCSGLTLKKVQMLANTLL